MTVEDLEEILSTLPKKMQVVIPVGDLFITTCKEQSEVIVVMPDEERAEPEPVFLLLPCTCNDEIPLGEINSQPELN